MLAALVAALLLLPGAADLVAAQSRQDPLAGTSAADVPKKTGGAGNSSQATATPSPTVRPTLAPLPSADSVEARMLAGINAERLDQGLVPVAWSPELAEAARRHSADMAVNGYLDHEGLDGSSPADRAAQQGYIVPSGTGWLVIEAISAMPTMDSALNWLLTDGLHRRVLLRPYFREVGIGHVAGGPYGHYWTLDFGCRPNVLPVFPSPGSAPNSVALSFSNEDCAPYGGGPSRMGHATQMMLGPRDDLRRGVWEPYVTAKEVPRPKNGELLAVLRDDQGRQSQPARILLGPPMRATIEMGLALNATDAITPTATATVTSTPTPRIR
ncbi:MAG: CAP domain-containing protein [Chloroflexi bacterium]|nr:CAP domain-containing protein [Chloroflexota bacterium]